MKKISLLGATGSIGQQTLDVVNEHRDQFQIVSLTFGSNLKLGIKAIEQFKPKYVAVKDKDTYNQLVDYFSGMKSDVILSYGEEGINEAAIYDEAEVVVNALIGSIGLIPTLKAIEKKKAIALANKETLVTAGHIVTEYAKKYNVPLLPVDSEHSAIYQALQGENRKNLSRLIITASGGSFRDLSREELVDVTVEDALKHPNWTMGAKITIDSATMMNKGLEVIEAHWLFDVDYDHIDVLIHKESIIHSLVEFHDRSVIAQLGTPDMRVPIQYALTYPDRLPIRNADSLNLWEIGKLHFEKANFNRYRCLQFAFNAGRTGGTMPTVLNAANEVAVAAFLQKQISFLQIEDFVEEALLWHEVITKPGLEEIQLVDRQTRQFVRSLIT